MVRDISYGSACLYLAGPAKPHTFLWCNTYLMAVQLTFELELRWTRYQKNAINGTVIAISIIKNHP